MKESCSVYKSSNWEGLLAWLHKHTVAAKTLVSWAQCRAKKMFFRTHVEDQSLRGLLLKALKPVCKDQGGWGAPHLIDIKRMGGWGGHLSHLHQLWHIFIQHLSIDNQLNFLYKQMLGPPFSPKQVWESFKLKDIVIANERTLPANHF